MKRDAALLCLALLLRGASAPAQSVSVRGGEGEGPALLRTALAGPHVLIGPDTGPILLRRDSTYGTTVIVLGRDAQVASGVRGDVIVVHGDLFLHPGARISGRAVALGGRVFDDRLALARQQLSYPDVVYAVEETTAGYELVLQPPTTPIAPPTSTLITVDRLTYERIDGLSPRGRGQLTTLGGQMTAGADLTYRSQLGAFDPGLDLNVSRGTFGIAARAARGTFTNDAWIHSDLINSVESLAIGKDLRNYFRADRGEVFAATRIESINGSLEPRLGFRIERDWSAGRDSTGSSAPWSFIRWRSPEGMMRSNPPISDGHMSSILGGADWSWAFEDSHVAISGVEELAVGGSFSHFAQTTLHGRLDLPAARGQSYHLLVHGVFTAGGAPAQRWTYLGGSETIGTLEALSFGGDELFFVANQYQWPLPIVEVPMLGEPAVILHHVFGTAGVGGLAPVQQAVGVRVLLVPVYGEILVDPFHRHAKATAGLSLGF